MLQSDCWNPGSRFSAQSSPKEQYFKYLKLSHHTQLQQPCMHQLNPPKKKSAPPAAKKDSSGASQVQTSTSSKQRAKACHGLREAPKQNMAFGSKQWSLFLKVISFRTQDNDLCHTEEGKKRLEVFGPEKLWTGPCFIWPCPLERACSNIFHCAGKVPIRSIGPPFEVLLLQGILDYLVSSQLRSWPEKWQKSSLFRSTTWDSFHFCQKIDAIWSTGICLKFESCSCFIIRIKVRYITCAYMYIHILHIYSM